MLMQSRMLSLSLLLACLFLFLFGCAPRADISPQAINGILSASNWDFEKNGPLKLSGEWNFYWQQLLTNHRETELLARQKHTLKLPRLWNGYIINGKTLSGKGFATLTLTITLNKNEINKPKAIYMPFAYTAYRLFIDGKAVASNGVVGKTKAEMQPQTRAQVIYFTPQHEQIELTLQVSNFMHKKGGAWKDIFLGETGQIAQLREKRLIFDVTLASTLLIMGIYHFILYLLRRQNKSALYFGIFCLIIGTRTLLNGELILTTLFPLFDWEIALKIEYIDLYISLPVFVMFMHSMYPRDVNKALVKILKWPVAFFSLLTLVTPGSVYTETLFVYYIIMLLCILYLIYLFALIMIRKREFAWLNGSVGTIFLLTAINDILHYSQWIRTGNATSIGLFLFIFVQSFILSVKFSRAFAAVERMSAELKELNNNLEEKVKERTKELEHSLYEIATAHAEKSALAERNRMAGEIHDIVGHTLTTIIVQIEAGKRLIHKNLPLAIEKLELAQELVRNGLNKIRRTIHMVKEDETTFDLSSALTNLIQMTKKYASVDIEYSIDPLPPLTLFQKKFIYHALQEGITNGIRHGKSTHFTFMLQVIEGSLLFRLQDNGTGCAQLSYGFGLRTMESRAHELDGQLFITSEKDNGCVLTITLLLNKKTHQQQSG